MKYMVYLIIALLPLVTFINSHELSSDELESIIEKSELSQFSLTSIKNSIVNYVKKKFFKTEPVEHLVKTDGYLFESHYVKTPDNYILNIHRIPFRGNKPKAVVFLQHGILSSSVDWFVCGPNKSLAYYLSDSGFDVWMGNARGNRFSRNHTSLDPSKNAKEFWDFSFHEIGKTDLPTMIRYVLNNTNQLNLYYVGHSQGSTVFYVMCSENPEVNNLIRAHFILSPVAYMGHIYNPLLQAIANLRISSVLKLFGKYEVSPHEGLVHAIMKGTCTWGKVFCKNVLYLINGYNPSQLNKTLLPKILSFTPAGSSTKQILHFLQEVKSGKFRQFDYGEKANIKKYGTREPPAYNLTRTTSDAFMYVSQNDWFSSKVDTDRVVNELGSKFKEILMIQNDQWTHLDFMYGIRAVDLVYRHILFVLNVYSI